MQTRTPDDDYPKYHSSFNKRFKTCFRNANQDNIKNRRKLWGDYERKVQLFKLSQINEVIGASTGLPHTTSQLEARLVLLPGGQTGSKCGQSCKSFLKYNKHHFLASCSFIVKKNKKPLFR